jgi:hypothetical protein
LEINKNEKESSGSQSIKIKKIYQPIRLPGLKPWVCLRQAQDPEYSRGAQG